MTPRFPTRGARSPLRPQPSHALPRARLGSSWRERSTSPGRRGADAQTAPSDPSSSFTGSDETGCAESAPRVGTPTASQALCVGLLKD